MGMKYFSVHHRQEAGASLDGLAADAEFVKEGFSWPAFLIPLFWLIYKRMWIALAFAVAVQALLVAAAQAELVPEAAISVLGLFASLLLGFEGNNLYRWTLARRRYRETGYVAASSHALAELRYFAARSAPSGGPAGPPA